MDDVQDATMSTQNGGTSDGAFPAESRELELLNDELRSLNEEKLKLESEVTREESTMRLKQSEIKSLQNEAETLQQMIKQLDVQKGEARKRLDDLAVQNQLLNDTLSELTDSINERKFQVENLKKQLDEQKGVVEGQESEMMAKKQEIDQLKSEEGQLQGKLNLFKNDVDILSHNLGQTQLQIGQVKAKLLLLEEYERQLQTGTSDLDAAITSNDYHKLNTLLMRPVTPPPELQTFQTGFDSDPFKDKGGDFPSMTNEFAADPFAGEDPFKGEDPFTNEDAFPSSGFAAFADDPFSGGPSAAAAQSGDPFDPFGALSMPAKQVAAPGSDPFSERTGSPAPELPPKKGKQQQGQQPPRPVAPKGGKTTDDPFKAGDPWADAGAGGASGGGGFANFANFDAFASQSLWN